MVCVGFSTFSGCGNCKVLFNNKKEMSKLTPSSISDIVCDIMDIFTVNAYTDIDLSCSSVSCTGSTDIIYLKCRKRRNLQKVVLGLVCSWYTFNESYATELRSLIYIMGLVKVFSSFGTNSDNDRSINQLISVLEYTEDITNIPLTF